jgi:hypothetical protein
MKSYFYFILIILLFRIMYSFLLIYSVYNKIIDKQDSENLIYWKNITGFVYTFSMGVLILYIFRNAKSSNKLCINDKYTIMLIYLVGIVLIINANWNLFFSEDEFILKIKQYINPIRNAIKK